MAFFDTLLYLTQKVPILRRQVDQMRALTADIRAALHAFAELTEKTSLRDSVAYVQTEALPTNVASFENGVRVLQAAANGALLLDYVDPTVSTHVLVCGETDERNNGVYVIDSKGSGSTKWKLTRHTNFRLSRDYTPYRTLFSYAGSTNAFHAFRLTSPGYPRLDHDPLRFEELSTIKPGQVWSGRSYITGGADKEVVLYLPLYGTYDWLFISVETVTAGTGGDQIKIVRRRSDTLVDSDFLTFDISSSGARQVHYPVLTAMSPVFSNQLTGISFYPVIKLINGSGADIPTVAVRYSFVRLG